MCTKNSSIEAFHQTVTDGIVIILASTSIELGTIAQDLFLYVLSQSTQSHDFTLPELLMAYNCVSNDYSCKIFLPNSDDPIGASSDNIVRQNMLNYNKTCS